MGYCKSNMKTNDKKQNKKEKGQSLLRSFEKLCFWSNQHKGRHQSEEDAPRLFANIIEEADKKILELIAKKKAEFESEHGQEIYNSQALALLKTIQYHIDENTVELIKVIEKMADYGDLKK